MLVHTFDNIGLPFLTLLQVNQAFQIYSCGYSFKLLKLAAERLDLLGFMNCWRMAYTLD
jgi:hypothetical protein